MLNKVILIGRLTADPELRQTQSGISTCRFSIAVDRAYQKDKEKQVDFINIQTWRTTADFVNKYFAKGKMIIVEGSLQNNNYEKDGVKHYSMIIVADNVSFGESKGSNNDSPAPQQTQQTKPAPVTNNAVNVSDLKDFEEILSDGEVPF